MNCGIVHPLRNSPLFECDELFNFCFLAFDVSFVLEGDLDLSYHLFAQASWWIAQISIMDLRSAKDLCQRLCSHPSAVQSGQLGIDAGFFLKGFSIVSFGQEVDITTD